MEEILDGATDGKFLYKMKMLNKSNINKMTYKVSIPRSCDSVKVKSNSMCENFLYKPKLEFILEMC